MNDTVQATGTVIANFASQHLKAASLFRDHVIAHGSKLRAQMSDFETEFWGSKGRKGIERKRTLDKYQLALSMLNVSNFDENTSPYCGASALVELRNALIHHKPTWDCARHRQVKLAEVPKGRSPVSPFPDEGADFVTMKCMSSGCAIWAVEMVVAFVSEFDVRAKLDTRKIRAFLDLGTPCRPLT